jgi:hypothetical protein
MKIGKNYWLLWRVFVFAMPICFPDADAKCGKQIIQQNSAHLVRWSGEALGLVRVFNARDLVLDSRVFNRGDLICVRDCALQMHLCE